MSRSLNSLWFHSFPISIAANEAVSSGKTSSGAITVPLFAPSLHPTVYTASYGTASTGLSTPILSASTAEGSLAVAANSITASQTVFVVSPSSSLSTTTSQRDTVQPLTSKFDLAKFKTVIDKDDKDFWRRQFTATDSNMISHIRTNISSESEFQQFQKLMEMETKTKFTVRTPATRIRSVWSRVFQCQHGTHKMKNKTTSHWKKTGYIKVTSYYSLDKLKL